MRARTSRILVSLGLALATAGCGGAEPEGGTGGAGGTTTSGSGGSTSCACTSGGYVPVCGADGEPYNAACGLECVPVAIACIGACPCPETCAELEADYASALAAAKTCDAALPGAPCSALVPDALGCPCDTFANPANTAALATLDELRASFVAVGCDLSVDCPAVECPVVGSATCTTGATGDGCVDGPP